ncbi:hypothetical protein XELAEV_18026463mg, partial [Xenopus laevis]
CTWEGTFSAGGSQSGALSNLADNDTPPLLAHVQKSRGSASAHAWKSASAAEIIMRMRRESANVHAHTLF